MNYLRKLAFQAAVMDDVSVDHNRVDQVAVEERADEIRIITESQLVGIRIPSRDVDVVQLLELLLIDLF